MKHQVKEKQSSRGRRRSMPRTRLISKEFMILISIASVIAIPLAYYFMDTWLRTFAYKIVLSNQVGLFVISAAMAFIITLLTVTYHTMRAATANPVNALREE